MESDTVYWTNPPQLPPQAALRKEAFVMALQLHARADEEYDPQVVLEDAEKLYQWMGNGTPMA